LRHSTDGGESWSARQLLAESFRQDGVLFKWNCPRIGQLGDGRLWVLCDGYPLPPGEARTQDSRVHFWWSEDEGRTWSDPEPTPIAGIVPDRLLVTQAGTWVVAAHLEYSDIVQYGYRSEDQGQTWSEPIVVCQQAGLQPCEASLVQLPDDGLLVAYMRENSGQGWPGPKCFSRDDGRTWEGPYETDMLGCHRPVAGLLADGRVLVTYRQTSRSRPNWAKNFAAYLEDQVSAREVEPTRQTGTVLPLDHDRHSPADQGYSGWVALPGERLLVVNYICDTAPAAHIRGYVLALADF
jgi:sialidase-1